MIGSYKVKNADSESKGRWADLRKLLLSLKATGESGFEGLMARLLGVETGSRYFLARAGDQRSGDALSIEAGVSVQAKLYNSTRINENNIEGEIRGLIAEIPHVDLYFLVSTSADSTAQLESRLDRIESETGLDIVFETFSEDANPVGALLVTHFESIRDHFPDLDDGLNDWIAEARDSPSCQMQLALLRRRLKRCRTFDKFARAADETRARRIQAFCREGGNTPSDSIHRQQIAENLKEWWEKNPPDNLEFFRSSGGVAVLIGEEGTGKSWAAASFAEEVSKSKSGSVFWLNSLDWSMMDSVDGVLLAAARSVAGVEADDGFAEKIVKKIKLRWDRPTLIVLDGANERGALRAAERIVGDYENHADTLFHNVKLLFTTRASDVLPVSSRIWGKTRMIKVAEFSNQEFADALEKYAVGVSLGDVPDSLLPLAKIPRYFHLSLRLIDRFKGLSRVTKEILLFAELVSKLERGDPQLSDVTNKIGGAPGEILAELAKRAGVLKEDRFLVKCGAISMEMPAFLEARDDLIEQRVIVSSGPTEIGISKNHIIIGWAVVLLEVAIQAESKEIELVWDQLLHALEPASSNDWKADAIYTALLISTLDSPSYPLATRTVLLLAWIRHHNSPSLTDENLQYFAEDNLESYTRMVEVMFRDHPGGGTETMLIAPLARIWRDELQNVSELEEIIKRWLLLIYPGGKEGSKSGEEKPPSHYSLAETEEQLALSFAAISILSFRPTQNLLPCLVDFYRSTNFCYEGIKPSRYPVKSGSGSFALLLRWHYGENFIAYLTENFVDPNAPEEEKEELWWLARLLRLAELPPSIGEAKDTVQRSGSTLEHYESLRDQLRENGEGNSLGYGVLDGVPLRDSFEQLDAVDVSALMDQLRSNIDKIASSSNFPSAQDLVQVIGALPFAARYDPAGYHAAVNRLWKAALLQVDPEGLIISIDDWVPGIPDPDLVPEILHAATRIFEKNQALAAVRLTLLVLLYGSEVQQIEWFDIAQRLEPNRAAGTLVRLVPVGDLLSLLGSNGLKSHAELKVHELLTSEEELSPASTRELRHWIGVRSHIDPTGKIEGIDHLRLVERIPDEKGMALDLLQVGLRGIDAESFVETICHPSFRSSQVGFAVIHWLRAFPPGRWPKFDTSMVLENASLSLAGVIFSASKDTIGLDRWGEKVFEQVAKLLELEGVDESKVRYEFDSSGRFAGTGPIDLPEGSERQFARSSNAWGVDREMSRPMPTREEFEKHFQSYLAKIEAERDVLSHEFRNFNARPELLLWAKRNPKRFRELAVPLFDLVDSAGISPGKTLALATFISSLKLAFLHASPREAIRRFFQLPDGSQVFNKHGGNWAFDAIWDREFDDIAECNDLRTMWITESRDEDALLWLVCGAIRHGNEDRILAFTREMFESELARERALGVSLTAFLCPEGADEVMAEIAKNDKSFWIRDHASWAFNVCETERAVRNILRQAAKSTAVSDAARLVGLIAPSLTPMTLAAYKKIKMDFSDSLPETVALVDNLFYCYQNSSRSSSRVKVGRRVLSEYCRGQKLKDGETSRMSPWWVLD